MVRPSRFPALGRRQFLTAASAAGAAIVPTHFGILKAAEDTIRIGFPVPLTGPFGTQAQDQVRAAQIAIAEFNDAGGLNGRKAELLVRDDKLSPTEAASLAVELIEKDKVHFLSGSLSAAVQLSVNNVAKASKVIYNSISQSDGIGEVANWSPYTFHEALNPHLTAGAVARYSFPRFGKRAVFLTADYAFGHECVRGFRNVGDAMGVRTLADIRHPVGTTDFTPFLQRIRALRPDILCVSNFGKDQETVMRQIEEAGLKQSMRVVVPVLLYSSRVNVGPKPFEGVVGGASFYWRLEDAHASTKAFNDRFRAAHNGAVPSDYGALGYGGIRTILAAAKNAGTTETDKVIEALRSLRYDFYKGPQYFRACDHQSVQSVLILESKSSDQKNEHDVFSILHVENPSEENLRSCQALGHT